MKTVQIAPSVLSADFLHLGKQLEDVEKAGADLIHFDVMDGKFVPEISYGEPVLRSIKKQCGLPVDVHLMIEEPFVNLESFAAAGADSITVHLEACKDVRRTLEKIRSLGVSAGLAIRPDTPVEAVFPHLDILDMVLVMTVYPGFGGQPFLESSLERISCLKAVLEKTSPDTHIQVDGGINRNTIRRAVEAGADIFVAGSAVFKGDITANVSELRMLMNS